MEDNNIFRKHEAPSFDDINNDDHISEVYSDFNDLSHGPSYDQVVASVANPSSAVDVDDVSRYRGRRNKNGRSRTDSHEGEEEGGGNFFWDPTVAHVRTGSIFLPVEMTLPSDGDTDGVEPAAPSYSVKQSRVSLYAAFPPPPIVLRPNKVSSTIDGSIMPIYDESELAHARRKLRQYSGFHTSVAATSATRFAEGYADTILSLNYRLPNLISFLLQKKAVGVGVGDMHYNLHLGGGSNAKASLGSTFSTLDGRTQLRWDVGNPFYHYHVMSSNNTATNRYDKKSGIGKKRGGLLSPSSMSDYTISASHDLFFPSLSNNSNPLRASWVMKWSPLPPPMFLPSKNNNGMRSRRTSSSSSVTPLHLQHLHVTLKTMNPYDVHSKKHCSDDKGRRISNLPKMSLRLGLGMPLSGSDGLWVDPHSNNSSGYENANINCGDNEDKSSTLHSASLKFDVEQNLSTSQSCQSTFEYQHSGQVLSLGTIFLRTFASSSFSRLGFGVRHAVGNIFHPSTTSSWWKNGSTSWLFQLERGDVRFLIPVTMYPRALTSWDTLLRIFCASFVSIVADAIAAELLCGVTSRMRLKFLRLLLGEDEVGGELASSAIEDDGVKKEQEREDEWLQQRFAKVQEDTSRQVNLMIRQANIVTRKEEKLGGLVIVKAVYGVMDDTSRQWLHRREEKRAERTTPVDEKRWHTMDATTQLKFWITDSSLHLPAVSKKHMLGFYDVLAFVSEDEWKVSNTPLSTMDEKESDNDSRFRFTGSFTKFCKGELWATEKNERDLAVVLSVRYKWDGKLYDVMFYDEEAVDLPSQYAQEVNNE